MKSCHLMSMKTCVKGVVVFVFPEERRRRLLPLIKLRVPTCVVCAMILMGVLLAPGVWPGEGAVIRSVATCLSGPLGRFVMYQPGELAYYPFCLWDLEMIHCMLFINVWYATTQDRSSVCYHICTGAFMATWSIWILGGLACLAFAR